MRTEKRIFALGFFDGVHLGHQALLKECVRLADQLAVQTAAITFDRHPRALFDPAPPALINTVEDRQYWLRHYGIEHIRVYPTTKEVMSTPWADFLEELIQQGAAGFVCGADFRFGHRGEGDAQKLQSFCAQRDLPCIVVPDQELDGARISSTRIRLLLEQGDVERATALLGHPHMLSGTVMAGRQLGRTIGIPTANLWIPEGVLTPRFGVYACTAETEAGTWLAVTNVGTRPTVGGHRVTVEPWLLDFSGDLYGKPLRLRFYQFLRPERKFDSLEALQQEIHRNAEQTRSLLTKNLL